LRWLQDVRRYQPLTVSRRLSIVIGGVEELGQAGSDHPAVPAEAVEGVDASAGDAGGDAAAADLCSQRGN
jgi:hypothetical protein